MFFKTVRPGDIWPCQKIVYEDRTLEYADIYFDDGVAYGVAGEHFEPMGCVVEVANATITPLLEENVFDDHDTGCGCDFCQG